MRWSCCLERLPLTASSVPRESRSQPGPARKAKASSVAWARPAPDRPSSGSMPAPLRQGWPSAILPARPLLLLLGLAAVRRQWSLVGRFFAIGAFRAGLALALPWFAYIAGRFGTSVFMHEAGAAVAGAGHRGWFVQYVPELFVATAPWSAFAAAALWAAFQRRRDPRIASLLLWIASILSRSAWRPNKSSLPPPMILVGWLSDEALSLPGAPLQRWMRHCLQAPST